MPGVTRVYANTLLVYYVFACTIPCRITQLCLAKSSRWHTNILRRISLLCPMRWCSPFNRRHPQCFFTLLLVFLFTALMLDVALVALFWLGMPTEPSVGICCVPSGCGAAAWGSGLLPGRSTLDVEVIGGFCYQVAGSTVKATDGDETCNERTGRLLSSCGQNSTLLKAMCDVNKSVTLPGGLAVEDYHSQVVEDMRAKTVGPIFAKTVIAFLTLFATFCAIYSCTCRSGKRGHAWLCILYIAVVANVVVTIVVYVRRDNNLEWSCLDGLTPDVADTCSLAIDLCPLASGFHYFKWAQALDPVPSWLIVPYILLYIVAYLMYAVRASVAAHASHVFQQPPLHFVQDLLAANSSRYQLATAHAGAEDPERLEERPSVAPLHPAMDEPPRPPSHPPPRVGPDDLPRPPILRPAPAPPSAQALQDPKLSHTSTASEERQRTASGHTGSAALPPNLSFDDTLDTMTYTWSAHAGAAQPLPLDRPHGPPDRLADGSIGSPPIASPNGFENGGIRPEDVAAQLHVALGKRPPSPPSLRPLAARTPPVPRPLSPTTPNLPPAPHSIPKAPHPASRHGALAVPDVADEFPKPPLGKHDPHSHSANSLSDDDVPLGMSLLPAAKGPHKPPLKQATPKRPEKDPDATSSPHT